MKKIAITLFLMAVATKSMAGMTYTYKNAAGERVVSTVAISAIERKEKALELTEVSYTPDPEVVAAYENKARIKELNRLEREKKAAEKLRLAEEEKEREVQRTRTAREEKEQAERVALQNRQRPVEYSRQKQETTRTGYNPERLESIVSIPGVDDKVLLKFCMEYCASLASLGSDGWKRCVYGCTNNDPR